MLRIYNYYFNKRCLVQSRMGALLLLDQISVVDRQLLLRGEWEAPQVDFL